MADVQIYTDSQIYHKKYQVKFSEIFFAANYNSSREKNEEKEEDGVPLFDCTINSDKPQIIVGVNENLYPELRHSTRFRNQPG